MSVIAKAIADGESEIERLQAENQGVERRRQDPWGLCPGEARGSALLLAAASGCGHPGSGDRVRRHTEEEAPSDDGQRQGGGVRADESLLGRAQKVKPRSSPPPAAGGSPGEPGAPTDPGVQPSEIPSFYHVNQ